jgi:cardiolipin synthase
MNVSSLPTHPSGAALAPRLDVQRPLEALIGVPFTKGNAVEVLRNGVQMFPARLTEVRAATRSLDLLWFLWGRGDITREVTGALAERARAGVRVRVLLDGFGARGIDRGLLAELRQVGCDVHFYAPLRSWRVTSVNMRTHRRVLVRDGTVAVTGGTGIDVAWTGDAEDPAHWRDTAFRIRGPAVDGMHAAFAADWVQTSRPLLDGTDRFPAQPTAGTSAVQVVRAGSQPGWNECVITLLAVLHLAREQVRVATPYVRLLARFRAALTGAARRGVQVQLLVNGPHADRRAIQLQGERDYAELLAGGVEL